jgi:hypothetical protein
MRQIQGKSTGALAPEVIMELLSRIYGWTPEEIKKQSYSDIKNYLTIIGARNKIEKFKQNYGR